MSETNTNPELSKEIGLRLKGFRQEIMKRSHITFAEYSTEVNIPAKTLEAYEKGVDCPGHDDLVKISRCYGLNLNWLYNENGGMFFCREKDMEEMIRYIESDSSGRYEHYLMLLKSMQVPEMEDFVFYVHGAVVDLLSRVEHAISNSKGSTGILSDMTEDVDYQWPRIFGKEPGAAPRRS